MAFTQSRIFQILDKGDKTDKTSLACDYFLSILIFLNLLAVCLESISSLGETYQRQFFMFEIFSVLVFAIEYLLRIFFESENVSL